MDQIKKVTSELSDELMREQLHLTDEITYHPVPHQDGLPRPTWRVRLELAYDPSQAIGLDINDELILGRSGEGPDFVALFEEAVADRLGVSRRHVLLRPTETKLYILDLNSTNGTWLNGRSIGLNTPYSLANGDLITVGRLDMVVKIIKRPRNITKMLEETSDLAAVIPSVACAITGQLQREEALKQALEMTLALTEASEAGIWLVDERTGELFLETGMGINNDQITRLPVASTLPGQVIESGKPLRASREADGEMVKVKTGYLVEAVIYIPLTLGGVTFGVLSAVHHGPGKLFNQREEKLMTAIADFTAVAVQNARLYQSTEHALTHRIKLLTALNYALSYDLKNKLKSVVGYAGLLADNPALDSDTAEAIHQILTTGDSMLGLIERLIEVTVLNDESTAHHKPCNVVDIARRAIAAIQKKADAKAVDISFEVIGVAYNIHGDIGRLYRSILNLLDNAVKYTPYESQVEVNLSYSDSEIVLQVRDTGPGISEEDLPYLFERYFPSQPSVDGEIGIGLGLELVHSTAEAHRGSVTARNHETGGAEIIVKLPATLRVV